MNQFPQQEERFFLPGPAGQLEVLTTWPKEAAKKRVGIICHPHPQQEGTMNNKVVTTIAKAFDRLGLATVRFNFRGVGKSEGEYAKTIGERDDLSAIVEWVRHVLPDYEIWLAGFSFGSYIAASIANQERVSQLLTIATTVNHYDFASLTNIQCPWLSIVGEQDELVPVEEVEAFAAHPPVPMKLIVLPEVGHFFHGHLIELRELIITELS
ncbi:alpha/beta hydrolase [Candidiatus Paracoxiella cheracis]|uniref:alpha/beta hydrolase n=1 Tax=Candidiatus Paracoxiella cheracis TaxID=3405120 RepID=UPI003BF4F451